MPKARHKTSSFAQVSEDEERQKTKDKRHKTQISLRSPPWRGKGWVIMGKRKTKVIDRNYTLTYFLSAFVLHFYLVTFIFIKRTLLPDC
jgi:hypothetical protein